MEASKSPVHSSEPIEVGNLTFQLSSRNADLLDKTCAAFMKAAAKTESCQVIDLDTMFELNGEMVLSGEPRLSILRVANVALQAHQTLLYSEGCAFTMGDGKPVLLLGASHSGKSTLTVAGTLRDGWKILSEDMIFFDGTKIVPLVIPVSLRPGSERLIEAAVGGSLSISYGKWYVNPAVFERQALASPALAAVVLETVEPGASLQVSALDRGEVVRRLLSWSNYLLFDDGPESIWSWLPADKCWSLAGGSVAERLDAVRNML